MMNHAMPARCGPPSGFNAVPSVPHSLPFAYITCCIRVSFESGLEITSLCAGSGGLNNRRQQPTPDMVGVVVSLMHAPCATSGVVFLFAIVPEPGCFCFGGVAY